MCIFLMRTFANVIRAFAFYKLPAEQKAILLSVKQEKSKMAAVSLLNGRKPAPVQFSEKSRFKPYLPVHKLLLLNIPIKSILRGCFRGG